MQSQIKSRLHYPKATWIRLGNDFDVRSVVEAKGIDFRKNAEQQTLSATKGVFIPPLQKVGTPMFQPRLGWLICRCNTAGANLISAWRCVAYYRRRH